MTASFGGGATLTGNYFTAGPAMDVRFDDGVWWTTCPECPGFTAAADDWSELMALVRLFHESPGATHKGWTMVQPLVVL